MTQKAASPAMEFLVDSLKRNPKAAYADLKAKADEKKLKVFPIMFGRAQLLLGIVKRGGGRDKAARAKASGGVSVGAGRKIDPSSKSGRIRALLGSGMSTTDIAKKVGCTVQLVYNVKGAMGKAGGALKRGPGRPPKAARSSVSNLDGIAGILDVVKNAERQRTQMRAALEKIQSVIADALA